MRVANCATGSSAFTMRGLCRLGLRSRWTASTAPMPATVANGLRLRGCGRHHDLLPVRHLRGNRLRWTTGTAGPPLAACCPAATTATVCGPLPGGDAPEQRLDRGPDLLLHEVADHRQQAPLPRHRFLLSATDPASFKSSVTAMRAEHQLGTHPPHPLRRLRSDTSK